MPILCFNPRTHTGCDVVPVQGPQPLYVSIHAPTRGATSERVLQVREFDGFQSTHPHGVRRAHRPCSRQDFQVSIHAPTRGATRLSVATALQAGCFNPRTHTGCDNNHAQAILDKYRFQSTHPHGVRPFIFIRLCRSTMVSIHAPTRGATRPVEQIGAHVTFQSTHPHGVRHNIVAIIEHTGYVSIHAPTRGATELLLQRLAFLQVSIHAPTRGAT